MSINKMSKLSFFNVGKYSYKNSHEYDFSNIPRPHFCMGLLIKGTAQIKNVDGKCFDLVPGDIIFVPIASRYSAKWQGSPDVLYISVHFAFDPFCGLSENNRFALQKVSLPDFEELKRKFLFIYKNQSGSDAEQMATLSAFFDILSKVLPKLKRFSHNTIDERIERAVKYIHVNFDKEVTITKLAEIAGMSVPNFHIKFKKYMNMTPIEYKNHTSIVKAMQLLKSDTDASIEEISELLGFESSAYFRRLFKKYTSMSPRNYRKVELEL